MDRISDHDKINHIIQRIPLRIIGTEEFILITITNGLHCAKGSNAL